VRNWQNHLDDRNFPRILLGKNNKPNITNSYRVANEFLKCVLMALIVMVIFILKKKLGKRRVLFTHKILQWNKAQRRRVKIFL